MNFWKWILSTDLKGILWALAGFAALAIGIAMVDRSWVNSWQFFVFAVIPIFGGYVLIRWRKYKKGK